MHTPCHMLLLRSAASHEHCIDTLVWVLKKLVVHFGMKSFIKRTLTAWWAVLEKFGREREEALLPGPIKGLTQFLLRSDTKVTPLTNLPLQLLSLFLLALILNT